ncbi:MAG: helicase-related protein, partial [Candidatus Thermoplasmatota archaeon]|nr:helicase-related protein [Candidatus Thermoplasmatota archaeon]
RAIESNCSITPIRIGLSATVRPDTTAAKFLGGLDEHQRTRKVAIIRETSTKETNITIRTLADSIEGEDDTIEKIVGEIGNLMNTEKGSMVIFHNTRRSAEKTAYQLIEKGHDSVMPHHGSLGLDVRRTAEERLKEGSLKAIVSSTSLELGLDIGLVDLVCQISSPKDAGRLLQRFGRSGHTLKGSSRGILFPINGPDLLESMAVVRAAQKGKLKKLTVPANPLDVLGQFIIGISLKTGGSNKKEIWDIARSTYPFRNLKTRELRSLLDLLTKRLMGPNSVSPRLWYDSTMDTYIPRRNTRQAFYLNCGTIPKETTYKVVDEKNHRHLGDLSWDFGETLYERDVILMGSRPLRIIGFSG